MYSVDPSGETDIDWVIAQRKGTLEEAVEYAHRYAEERTEDYATTRDVLARTAARKAFEGGLLARTTDVDSRIRRELGRALAQYTAVWHGDD